MKTRAPIIVAIVFIIVGILAIRSYVQGIEAEYEAYESGSLSTSSGSEKVSIMHRFIKRVIPPSWAILESDFRSGHGYAIVQDPETNHKYLYSISSDGGDTMVRIDP